MVPTKLKSGGTHPPPFPTDLHPWSAHPSPRPNSKPRWSQSVCPPFSTPKQQTQMESKCLPTLLHTQTANPDGVKVSAHPSPRPNSKPRWSQSVCPPFSTPKQQTQVESKCLPTLLHTQTLKQQTQMESKCLPTLLPAQTANPDGVKVSAHPSPCPNSKPRWSQSVCPPFSTPKQQTQMESKCLPTPLPAQTANPDGVKVSDHPSPHPNSKPRLSQSVCPPFSPPKQQTQMESKCLPTLLPAQTANPDGVKVSAHPSPCPNSKPRWSQSVCPPFSTPKQQTQMESKCLPTLLHAQTANPDGVKVSAHPSPRPNSKPRWSKSVCPPFSTPKQQTQMESKCLPTLLHAQTANPDGVKVSAHPSPRPNSKPRWSQSVCPPFSTPKQQTQMESKCLPTLLPAQTANPDGVKVSAHPSPRPNSKPRWSQSVCPPFSTPKQQTQMESKCLPTLLPAQTANPDGVKVSAHPSPRPNSKPRWSQSVCPPFSTSKQQTQMESKCLPTLLPAQTANPDGVKVSAHPSPRPNSKPRWSQSVCPPFSPPKQQTQMESKCLPTLLHAQTANPDGVKVSAHPSPCPNSKPRWSQSVCPPFSPPKQQTQMESKCLPTLLHAQTANPDGVKVSAHPSPRPNSKPRWSQSVCPPFSTPKQQTQMESKCLPTLLPAQTANPDGVKVSAHPSPHPNSKPRWSQSVCPPFSTPKQQTQVESKCLPTLLPAQTANPDGVKVSAHPSPRPNSKPRWSQSVCPPFSPPKQQTQMESKCLPTLLPPKQQTQMESKCLPTLLPTQTANPDGVKVSAHPSPCPNSKPRWSQSVCPPFPHPNSKPRWSQSVCPPFSTPKQQTQMESKCLPTLLHTQTANQMESKCLPTHLPAQTANPDGVKVSAHPSPKQQTQMESKCQPTLLPAQTANPVKVSAHPSPRPNSKPKVSAHPFHSTPKQQTQMESKCLPTLLPAQSKPRWSQPTLLPNKPDGVKVSAHPSPHPNSKPTQMESTQCLPTLLLKVSAHPSPRPNSKPRWSQSVAQTANPVKVSAHPSPHPNSKPRWSQSVCPPFSPPKQQTQMESSVCPPFSTPKQQTQMESKCLPTLLPAQTKPRWSQSVCPPSPRPNSKPRWSQSVCPPFSPPKQQTQMESKCLPTLLHTQTANPDGVKVSAHPSAQTANPDGVKVSAHPSPRPNSKPRWSQSV